MNYIFYLLFRYAKKPKWSRSISNIMNKMNLNDLTREELVAIITDNRNVIQNLQQKCDEFKIHIDKWKQKSKMMQKMQQDLNDVVKRYVNHVETKRYILGEMKTESEQFHGFFKNIMFIFISGQWRSAIVQKKNLNFY